MRCEKTKRMYKAYQELEQVKLTIVRFRSVPDYTPQTINEKLIPEGCD